MDRPRARPGGAGPPPPVPRGEGPLSRPDPGGDGLVARLERWAAEARVDAAARARARERWLRVQASEDGTLAGVLVDLLEAGTPVTVRTRSGRDHRGVVRTVGADFVALAPAAAPGAGPGAGPGGEVLVALAAVSSVRCAPGARAVLGDRVVRTGLRLADVVAGLAAEREPVHLVIGAGEAVTGTVQAVGRDLAVVRATGEPPSVVYVPLGAVAEVAVAG